MSGCRKFQTLNLMLYNRTCCQRILSRFSLDRFLSSEYISIRYNESLINVVHGRSIYKYEELNFKSPLVQKMKKKELAECDGL